MLSVAVPHATDRLGPYELLDPIGEGGFARVYRVRRDGEELAAKVLAATASAEPAAVERFEREIEVLRGIKHPNLIELVDHGVDDERGPYMITRLITGMTLRELAAGRPLAPEAALLLIEPVLRALTAMHAVALVHRDIKPENVMVTPLGDVVVVDLGLALHGAHSRLTEAGSVTGSVPYMAPEQIEGGAIAPSTDVWAVGVMLYELVAGKRPFQRQRAGEELASILAATHEPLARVEPRVSSELDDFVERCLAREPEARFRDAASALEALEQCFDWITPRQMRAERAAVITDPGRYGERAAERRVALSCDQARELIARGEDFEALRILDCALSYRPDDERVLALVARASGERKRESAPVPESGVRSARRAAEVVSGTGPTAVRAREGAGSIYAALREDADADAGSDEARAAAGPKSPRWRSIAMVAGLVLGGAALGGIGFWAGRSGQDAPDSGEPVDAAPPDESASAASEEAEPSVQGGAAMEPGSPDHPGDTASDTAGDTADAVLSSPIPPSVPPDISDLRPIPLSLLSNDDPPRENDDIARPGESLVPASALGPDGPAAGLASIEAQLRARPGDAELEVGRALALIGNGRVHDGLSELERIARAHPDLATVWGARGYIAYRQGHLDEAERFLTRAIELDPAGATDWRNRGILRSKQGHSRDAYRDLVTALRYAPDDLQALTELAHIYEVAGRRMDARPLLERVVRSSPRNVVAWVDLSKTQPDPDQALQSLQRALAIDPNYPRALTGLCRHYAQHDAAEAIEACTRAAEVVPHDAGVYMHRGLAHYYLGDTEAALRDLDRAAQMDPNDSSIFTNRYLVRTHAGQTELARQDLQHACDLHNDTACAELRRTE